MLAVWLSVWCNLVSNLLFLHLKLKRVVKWKTKKQNMKGKIPGLLYVFEVGKRNAKHKKPSQF